MAATTTSSPQFKLQSKTPWLYWAIRCLFLFVMRASLTFACIRKLLTPLRLQTFYASIIVENADFITSDGEPT